MLQANDTAASFLAEFQGLHFHGLECARIEFDAFKQTVDSELTLDRNAKPPDQVL